MQGNFPNIRFWWVSESARVQTRGIAVRVWVSEGARVQSCGIALCACVCALVQVMYVLVKSVVCSGYPIGVV